MYEAINRVKRVRFCLPEGMLGIDDVAGVSGVSSELSAGGLAVELTGGAAGPLAAGKKSS
ncbi:hypothetical protein QQP08_003758 [Theobroma cacao]|nr:hypothetical protein QQP08_003758 [Theobroma cacao]